MAPFGSRVAKLVTVDKRVRWTAVFAWMLVIFAFSHQPYSGRASEKILHDYNVPVRKAGHVAEYLVLFILIRWAIDGTRKLSLREKVTNDSEYYTGTATKSGACIFPLGVIAFLAAALYAGLDEWHQSFVPGRSATLSDVGVDTCGIILGLALWTTLSSFLSRNCNQGSGSQT